MHKALYCGKITTCEICRRRVRGGQTGFEQHMKDYHEPLAEPIICALCGKMCNTKWEHETHEPCDKSKMSKKMLTRRYTLKYRNYMYKGQRCKLCKKRVLSEEADEHDKEYHEELAEKIVCAQCGGLYGR